MLCVMHAIRLEEQSLATAAAGGQRLLARVVGRRPSGQLV